MHWFAIVLSALHRFIAGAREVPAHGMLERVHPEALWLLRNR